MIFNLNAVTPLEINQLIEATKETIYISIIVSVLVFVLGVGLGLLLYAFGQEKLFKSKIAYAILNNIVNLLRSIPFIILLLLLMPLTNLIVGKISGPNAAIPPLVVSVVPFFARLVETTCKNLPQSLVELGLSLGLTKNKILTKIILKEATPAIVSNFTTTIISIISFSAMAGVIGAGGLGSLAYINGFQRNNEAIIYLSTILILLIVLIVQVGGNLSLKVIDKRNK